MHIVVSVTCKSSPLDITEDSATEWGIDHAKIIRPLAEDLQKFHSSLFGLPSNHKLPRAAETFSHKLLAECICVIYAHLKEAPLIDK